MQSGQTGYGDGGYHDAPPNRYDRIHSFSLNTHCKPFEVIGFDRFVNEWHSIRCFYLICTVILWVIFKTLVFYLVESIKNINTRNMYDTDTAIYMLLIINE